MERIIKRGDIYYAELSPVIGSEQGGTRPVLIISNDIGNRYSPTVIVRRSRAGRINADCRHTTIWTRSRGFLPTPSSCLNSYAPLIRNGSENGSRSLSSPAWKLSTFPYLSVLVSAEMRYHLPKGGAYEF